jgi:transposase
MMSIQSKPTVPAPQPLFAGIDAGAEELILVMRKNGTLYKAQKFANTAADRAQLAKKLAKLPGIIVCMEATGIYHLDLSIALHDAGVKLMVINPKASHNFANGLMKNNKTDAVDANTLSEYAERIDFVAWARLSSEPLIARGFSRRINALTRQKAAVKNHLHALSFAQDTPNSVLRDAKLAISQLEKRIDRLTQDDALIDREPPRIQSYI